MTVIDMGLDMGQTRTRTKSKFTDPDKEFCVHAIKTDVGDIFEISVTFAFVKNINDNKIDQPVTKIVKNISVINICHQQRFNKSSYF